MISLELHRDTFPTEGIFTIARGSRTSAEVIAVTLRDGPDGSPDGSLDGVTERGVDRRAGKGADRASGAVGRGECVPYARYGESLDSVAAQIESDARTRSATDWTGRRCSTRCRRVPPATRSTARCGIWRRSARGVPVWQLAGLARPGRGDHRVHAVARHARRDARGPRTVTRLVRC